MSDTPLTGWADHHANPKLPEESITVRYTNYRGEVSDRIILPRRIFFGSTEYHPKSQWLLDAYDFNKKAYRQFALIDIVFNPK